MTDLSRVQTARLLKLAKHLETPENHIHKTFDFSTLNECSFADLMAYKECWNDEEAVNNPKYGCGTAGCALGECPAIFDQWRFRWQEGDILPGLVGLEVPRGTWAIELSIRSAMEFFGLERGEVQHLFFPGQQLTSLYGGLKAIGTYSTANDVASHIRSFISTYVLGEK